MIRQVLIIGTVWPEPNSSAAGSRLMQLIDLFLKLNWRVDFACAAQKSPHAVNLDAYGIKSYFIKINDSSFDDLVKDLNPSMVLFDRFIIEEQFGWRVSQHCPNALKVLDTIDLHCLRNERQLAIKQKRLFALNDLLLNDMAKREIASIYRCDVSLMVSETETFILQSIFKVDASLLHYCPLMYEPITNETTQVWPSFEQRAHFISIGNFLHEPNWDSVLQLKTSIWPLIRKQLPHAELHVYGAYVSEKVQQLHNVKEGFIIKGRAEQVKEVMSWARVNLAPLRFGAGIKGKLLDAMLYGTPSVTTPIGAESMHGNWPWNGAVCEDTDDFVQQSVALYTNVRYWQQSQLNGIEIINHYFQKKQAEEKLILKINSTYDELTQHRKQNFIGNMLQHHQLASSKYMSLWIETKNKVIP